MEEDTVRLYTTIRYLQIFIEEGRVTSEEVSEWPSQLRALVKATPQQLIDAVHETGRNIVHQYLEDPGLTVEALLLLYSRLPLGHYDITQEAMVGLVRDSGIAPALKSEFLERVQKKGKRLPILDANAV